MLDYRSLLPLEYSFSVISTSFGHAPIQEVPLHFTLLEIGLDLEIILVDRTWQISRVCLSRLNNKKHASFSSSFTLGESRLPCLEVTLATLGGVARAEAFSQ